MKFPRRKFLHLAAGAAALSFVARSASALDYPTRPMRIVSGFAPGGVNDVMARLIGQSLSERLGHPVIIENRPGSSSNIATRFVINSVADGYTLLAAGTTNAINATLYRNLDFNFIRDVAPIVAVMRVPNILAVNLSFPAKTVPEFIAYAEANPGKINFGSGGSGTTVHMAGELFKMFAKVDMVHVPYRGEALALGDLLSGHLDVVFATAPSCIQQVKAGRLRALAVTTAARSASLPDIPALNEILPGYESSYWGGLAAPKNTAPEVISRLNSEINGALRDAKLQTRFDDLGASAIGGSPADFGKLIGEETEKWAQVVKLAKIEQE
jgi:tripartite-type tricarboxylate transporter receptor subunit TctC